MDMDIKKTLKNKIITDILSSIQDADWSILIYDKVCGSLLSHLFTKSEFISHNIVMSQFIQEDRDKADFPCVYFISGTEDITSIINKDYTDKMYTSYMVCSLTEPSGLSTDIDWKVVHVNFTGVEDRVFISDISNLYSVADTLSTYFYIEYTDKTLETSCNILEQKMKDHDRSGKCILFDRSVDFYTPIMHFFTFQCVLEEFGLVDAEFYEMYGDTKVWKEVRHIHLGDIPTVLKSYVQNITSNNSKLNSSVNTKDLMRMVMDAPESYATSQLLKLLFEYAKKCFNKLGYYEDICEIEQDIVTKVDKNKKKKIVTAEDILNYIKDKNIDKIDKLRLYWLYKISGGQIEDEMVEEMLQYGFTKDNFESDVLTKSPVIRQKYEFEYSISRYEPQISVILREYIRNDNALVKFTKLEKEKTKISSLRKSALISVKKKIDKNKICCVYIRGGLTYAEIRCIHRLKEELGVEFVIGSDKIIQGDDYMKCVVKSVE